jgi:NTP pyrophosphatase (non-canonical NTP hydrolase)
LIFSIFCQNENNGGEDLAYRVALMAEEVGEISACVTKGKTKGDLAEETADFFVFFLLFLGQ